MTAGGARDRDRHEVLMPKGPCPGVHGPVRFVEVDACRRLLHRRVLGRRLREVKVGRLIEVRHEVRRNCGGSAVAVSPRVAGSRGTKRTSRAQIATDKHASTINITVEKKQS
mgnify:CR=1 FL=1